MLQESRKSRDNCVMISTINVIIGVPFNDFRTAYILPLLSLDNYFDPSICNMKIFQESF